MKPLVELCNLIDQRKLVTIDCIGAAKDRTEELYRYIKDGRIQTDQEAEDLLFPQDKYAKISVWKLKQRLINRIANTIICGRYEGDSSILNEFREVEKKLLALRILRSRGKKKAALEMARSAIKKAIKYDFTELALTLARDLRIHYATIESDRKKFDHFTAIFEQYQKRYEIELVVERKFYDLALQIKNSKHFSESFIEETKRTANELKKVTSRDKSYWSVLLASQAQLYYYQMINDKEGISQVCNEAITYFESLSYEPPYTTVFSFSFILIPGYIVLRKFEEARREIDRCLKLAHDGQHNWLATKQFEIILCFYKGDYAKAITQIQSLKAINLNLNASYAEMLIMYEAYANLLSGEDIKIGKVLNEMPIFSQDKMGMNINILILQLITYIKRGDTSRALDRIPALQRYIYRHLNKPETIRAKCFIQMLFSLEKGYFYEEKVIKIAQPYLEKLQKYPLEETQNIDLEIVPYERLWDFVVEQLK